MERERQQEMVSAYLDGELAPDERAQVDQWLAESTELRQLRDDLLAMRASLRLLPNHKAPRDFSEVVQHEAIGDAQGIADGEEPNVKPASVGSLWARGAGWRRLAWPAIAIAAALLIMLFDNNREQPRQVARAPQENLAFKQQPGKPRENRDEELERTELGRGAESDSFAAPAADSVAGQTVKSAAIPGEAAAPVAGAPAAMPQTSSGAAAASARGLGQARKDAGQRSEMMVFEVTPEYFRDQSFEKLLERRKVKWSRAPVESAAEKRIFETDGQLGGSIGAEEGQTYAIEVSDVELSSLMDDLRSATNAPQLQSARPQQLESLSKPAERPGPSRERGRRILLRIVPKQSADPAAAPASR
ncbi:MAG TPA: zf-HC2 domain-containing protein [Pirellulales bacterium]|jgi:negative regulator of sigma E activity